MIRKRIRIQQPFVSFFFGRLRDALGSFFFVVVVVAKIPAPSRYPTMAAPQLNNVT